MGFVLPGKPMKSRIFAHWPCSDASAEQGTKCTETGKVLKIMPTKKRLKASVHRFLESRFSVHFDGCILERKPDSASAR